MENLTFQKYKMREILRISNLISAHYFSNQKNYQTPDHLHEEAWEFVFCSQGMIHTFQGGEERVLKNNQILFHPPKTIHHLKVDDESTTMLVLSFVCTSEVMKLLQNQILRVDQSQRRMLMVIIQELGNAFELHDGHLELIDFHSNPNPVLGAEQMITCYLEGFLIGLLRDATHQKEQKWDAVTLEKALENRLASDIKDYIEKHLSERITLAHIAEHVHYSRSYVTEQFQKAAGMSVASYISERRIEAAKEYLLQGNMSVSQISEKLGFSTVQYFSKCFKDAVGISPSLYSHSIHL